MRYTVLASDYDGTLAQDGRVGPGVLAALQALKDGGRRLVLVTGRELPDLRQTFPEVDLFDLIVAENGGLLVDAFTGTETLLAAPPPHEFADELRRLQVAALSVGRVVVASLRAYEEPIREVIDRMGLPLDISLNKGSLMVLPHGVDKGNGLKAALMRLNLAIEDVVGVGDAENDLPFLRMCGVSAAVSNALPDVARQVDIRLRSYRSQGVVDLMAAMLADSVDTLRTTATPLDS